MKLSNVVLALALSMPLSIPSFAQTGARIERLKETAKQLHLTREQEKQLMPIMESEEPKLEAIHNDPSLTKLQKLEKLKAIHDESNPQVKAILTPEQYQQLQEIRRKRRVELMQEAKNPTNR